MDTDKTTYEKLMRDINALQQKIAELSQVTKKIDNEHESGLVAYGIFDCESELETYSIEINDILDLNRDVPDIDSKVIEKFIHPNDLSLFQEKRNEAIENREDFLLNYQIVSANKEIKSILEKGRVILEDGKPKRIIFQIFDVSNVKKKESINNELAVLSRNLLASDAVLLVETDTKGRATLIKNAIEVITDYSEAELKTKYIWEVLALKSLNKVAAEENKLLSKGKLPQNMECSIQTKSGELRYWYLVNTEVVGDEGEIKIMSLGLDLTEIKKSELELKLEKVLAGDKDFSKTNLIQKISDKIKVPLNTVVGFSNLLKDSKLTSEKRNNFINIISNSANELNTIISDLLTYNSLDAKQEKASSDEVILNDLLSDLVKSFMKKAKSNKIELSFNKKLSDKESEVLTDKFKLTQILSNLLSNAIKFTEKGAVKIGFEVVGNEVEFYVKDTGIGMKNELRELFLKPDFDREFLFNQLEDGIGLGLSISKSFIDLLGGSMRIDSKLAKGTTFYFTIPHSSIDTKFKVTLSQKLDGEILTVLIAEDDEINYVLLKSLLKNNRIKILRAKDGREAYEIFKKNPEIDLILMDILMPGVDGYTAAQLIKKESPEIPIIAQSAYLLQSEQYGSTFDDYLSKPINKAEFQQKLKKYIEVFRQN